MYTFLYTILFFSCCVFFCAGYEHYQDRIPNGRNVPSPCNSSDISTGVGHIRSLGGGARNRFGDDFANNNHKWTEWLCNRDSDGDGKSNGEELGDPDCVWSEGKTPTRTTEITHPGVCTPLDNESCKVKNNGYVCPKPVFCKGFSEQRVISKDLRMTKTVIPNKETTYICQVMDMQVDGKKMHFVGSVPIIDNKEYVHHMILFKCSSKKNIQNLKQFECGMGGLGCNEMLDTWGVGAEGTCLNSLEGIIIDGTSDQKFTVVLQIHWNNPLKIQNVMDSSGLRVYMTESLRPNNAVIAVYGQILLDLPPKLPEIMRTHTCPKECTKKMIAKNITNVMLHMHLYGIKGRVSLWRNGVLVRDLIPMHNYDYNLPLVKNFDPPILYLPGDEIKTECYYNTQKADKYVYYGESTQDEMCYSFFRYFPVSKHYANCVGYGDFDYNLFVITADKYKIKGCNIADIFSGEIVKRNTEVGKICGSSDSMFCDPSCKALIPALHEKEPCLDPLKARLEFNFILASNHIVQPKNLFWNKDNIANRCDIMNFINQIKTCEDALVMKMPTNNSLPQTTISEQQTFILILVGTVLAALVVIILLGVIVIKIRAGTSFAERNGRERQYNSIMMSEHT